MARSWKTKRQARDLGLAKHQPQIILYAHRRKTMKCLLDLGLMPDSPITPIEEHGGHLTKRDDLYTFSDICGAKVRACVNLAQGDAKGLITASPRKSPQMQVVAATAAGLNLPCRIHTAYGETTPEMEWAQNKNDKLVFLKHKPGYSNVLQHRAMADAEKTKWRYIPFGMESYSTPELTRKQTANIPDDVSRIVICIGSGLSAAGMLWGLRDRGIDCPVLGVRVGADSTKRLNKYAPHGWRHQMTVVTSQHDYTKHLPDKIGDIVLDPYYESKCLEYLESGDLFWIIGRRPGD